MIKIILSVNEREIASCSYMELNPYSKTTAREFTFHNIIFVEGFQIKELWWCEYITVNVSFDLIDPSQSSGFEEIRIVPIDFSLRTNQIFWIKGLVYSDNNFEYRQGVIDVFNVWQQGKELDWVNDKLLIDQKEDYITACFYYTSVSSFIEKKDHYVFNFQEIENYIDFLCFAGQEFVGNRGYMGHSLHTFKDCLQVLNKNNLDFSDCRIVMLNVKEFRSKEIEKDYIEFIKPVFLEYNFILEER